MKILINNKSKRIENKDYWLMFGHHYIKNRDGEYREYYMHIGSYRYVEIHLLGKPIIPVKVIKDDHGDHFGWLDSDPKRHDGKPCMIWPTLTQLAICFPYGLEAAKKKGDGDMVRLIIKKYNYRKFKSVKLKTLDCNN